MTESSALGLFVLRPTGRGEPVLLLPGDPIVVGRTEEAELPLFDDSVSRAHTRLTHLGSAIQVEDLGSANGTFVNGKRCERTQAGPGDLLGFGALEFRLAFATAEEVGSRQWERKSSVVREPNQEVSPPVAAPAAPGACGRSPAEK